MDKVSIKSRVRRETVMMLIFGISGWIILIMFFYSLDRRSARREEEKETREEELNQMVKEYLENKYGENFMLEEPSYVSGSRWYGTGSGSPIPGMEGGTESGDPMYCYAYAESNMGFRFRVYVYPESLEKKLSINNVKEICDGYCWKFIKENMKIEIQKRLRNISDEEFKLLIISTGDKYSSNLTNNSTINDYLKEDRFWPHIRVYIFVKRNNEESEKEVKKYISEYIANLKGINNKFEVYLAYYKINDNDDFDSMDVIKEENELFSGYNIETPFWESAIWNLEMDKIFEDEVDNIYN